MKQIAKAAVLYFAIVFAIGFVLGSLRTVWLVPRVGVSTAELAEIPIMLLASVLTARWAFQRLWAPTSWRKRLASGVFALCLMLLAELGFVLWIRGLTIREYLQSRDPVSGTAYFMSLAVFAVVPVFVGREQQARRWAHAKKR